MTSIRSSAYSGRVLFALLAAACSSAWSQTDEQQLASACQASLQQMDLWCTKQQAGYLAGANCNETITDVDRSCYDKRLPQLACSAAQRESELWCGGNANLPEFYTGKKCSEARNKARSYCFR